MLKTNSRAAVENIRRYIMDHLNIDGDTPEPETFPEAAALIMETFREEKPPVGSYAMMSELARFVDWCSGLPSILDTGYYYNRSSVDDLGDILEETEVERSKHSESEAEEMLSRLIYRELRKAAK